MDSRIDNLPPGSDGIVLLPYFLGEKTPLHDPVARGTIFGLDPHHSRYHLFKAVLESVAYGFRHHFEVLAERKLPIRRVFASDGGAPSGEAGRCCASRRFSCQCRLRFYDERSLGG
jgi:xylulokinase